MNSVHDGSISCIGSTKWQYGLLQKSSNEEVSDKKAAKFSNPCRVLSQIQIRKLSSRHFPHLIGFSLPSCWTFSQTLVVIMMMLKLNFVAYLKCLVMGKIQLHKVNAVAWVRRVTENAKKDILNM